MTTNPDNMVRVRARNGGRASVYEANGWAQAFSAGLMDGDGVRQNTSADMNVLVGGTTSNPDVVIASNPAGYKIALDIVSTHAIAVNPPSTNKRISSIVAYTDDLSIGTSETAVTGSPSTCGLIVVNGNTSSSPVAPDDAMIRAAITADGATGSQASYAVIADVLVSRTTSIITNAIITNYRSGVTNTHIDWSTVDKNITSKMIDWSTINNVHINNWMDTPNVSSTFKECDRFVVPEKGLYFFGVHASCTTSTRTSLGAETTLNGTRQFATTGNANQASGSGDWSAYVDYATMIMCEEGDIVKLNCTSRSVTTTVSTRFIIERVG